MDIVYSNLSDFDKDDETTKKLIPLLKSKWDEIHNKPCIFRYKIDNLKERIVDEKYILQLNPDRATNRRTPEFTSNMNQPFNEEKFNFTKVSKDEVLFAIGKSATDPDLHSFIVNVSPISRYHTLFCPFVNKKLPQVITEESLSVAIQIMFIANDSYLKMGFNSLCGLASVNHLHFHLLMEKKLLLVEKAKRKHFLENLYYLVDHPASAFCFAIPKHSENHLKEAYRLIKYLQDASIAHNVFIKRVTSDIVEVYVYPRRSTSGVKQLMEFNVAVLELSGLFPVFKKEAFDNLTSEDLENEIKKWRYRDFEILLNKLPKLLYGRDL